MNPTDYFVSIVLSTVYVLLLGVFASYAAMWGDPTWWYQLWGKGNASALVWLQIVHSAAVAVAALPIAGFLAWWYRRAWFPPTSIAAILASLLILLDGIRGTWLLVDTDVQPAAYHLVSGGIDTVKVGLILLLVTALIIRVSHVREDRA